VAIQPSPLSDRRLRTAAEALEKRRDDIAAFVRWPALEASLAAEAATLRAAMRQPRAEHDPLDLLILDSIKRTGSTEAAEAEAEAQRQAGDGWRKLVKLRAQRLRVRGLIRYVAERWELA